MMMVVKLKPTIVYRSSVIQEGRLGILVLLNCKENKPFVLEYEKEVRDVMPNIDPQAMSTRLEKEFTSWFANYVKIHLNL